MKNLIKKIIAVITTVCVFCMIPLTSYAAPVISPILPQPRTRSWYDGMCTLIDMRENEITITIEHRGMFVENKSILYGRRAIGVNGDGTFILDKWEVLFEDKEIGIGDDGLRHVSGDYVCFAYSVDIGWGTDWPYSGIFWYNEYTEVHDINICVTGLPRMVQVFIDVNGTTIFEDWNCDAHNEWKP